MTDKPLERGQMIGHYPCPVHHGSDSLSLYRKENYIDGTCWANSDCGHFSPKRLKELGITDGKFEVLIEAAKPASRKGEFIMTDEIVEKLKEIQTKEIHGWPERKIPAVVNEFYGVYSDVEGSGGSKKLIKEYCPAYNQKDELVGFHVRNDAVKQAKNNGEKVDGVPFYSVGDVRSSTKLFGQNKFESGQKRIVLCSGQADARAVFTALNTEKVYDKELGKKVIKTTKYLTPVVSTQCGESSLAQIKSNFEWITSHEEVVILYDQDEAGRLGAEKIARILKAGQAKIGKYKRKDACEHSKRNEWEAIKTAYFKAERYSPVDVLHLGEMWEDFEKEDTNIKIPFPPSMVKLNEMMGGGMERGEITVVGALTSAGKSTIVNNIAYNLLENTDLKVGAFYLEGTKREVVRDMLSLDIRENLRLKKRDELDMVKLRNRFMGSLASKDRFVFVNHAGSIRNDEIFDKLHYLAEVEEADVIIFDPLQAGVNSSDNSQIIEFMDNLLKFAKKTNTCLIVVSHMRKPQSDNPHDVSEYDLLGSSSINQISFNTILASRDKMSADFKVKNSTHLKLVKCRRTGQTGDAGWVRYDNETTHFYPTGNPYDSIDEEVFDSELEINTDDCDQVEPKEQESAEWEVVDE